MQGILDIGKPRELIRADGMGGNLYWPEIEITLG